MKLNRRQFLLLTAGLAAGCQAWPPPGAAPAAAGSLLQAGQLTDYREDGVETRFRRRGVFLIRRGGRLTALSALCTHRQCLLSARPDGTFYCPCHGSTFDASGRVTHGPARRPLPVFPVEVDAEGRVTVRLVPAG